MEGSAPEVHPELVMRHLQLVGEQRQAERRSSERRVDVPGMAGVPGLDRRRGERRRTDIFAPNRRDQ